MKEPKKIRLSPDVPVAKDTTTKIRLLPVNTDGWDISGQDNDDTYIKIELDNLDENHEDHSQNN
jgi:hypothetical protein